MRVGAPIEEHADLVYTRAMYEKFYDELFEAGKFCVQREDGNDRFIVSPAKLSSDGVQKNMLLLCTERISCLASVVCMSI